jgi:hypothetical protein
MYGIHIEERSVDAPGIEEGKDVWMLQVGDRPDLVDEAIGADGGDDLSLYDLQGDLAIVAEVVREVNRRHASRTQLALDAVVARERFGQALRSHTHSRFWRIALSETDAERGHSCKKQDLTPTHSGASPAPRGTNSTATNARMVYTVIIRKSGR